MVLGGHFIFLFPAQDKSLYQYVLVYSPSDTIYLSMNHASLSRTGYKDYLPVYFAKSVNIYISTEYSRAHSHRYFMRLTGIYSVVLHYHTVR